MKLRGLKEGQPVLVDGKRGYTFVEVFLPGVATVLHDKVFTDISAKRVSLPKTRQELKAG